MLHTRRILILLAVVCSVSYATSASAQWRPQFLGGTAVDTILDVHSHTASMAFAGVGGGVAGLAAGVFVGNAIDRARGYDPDCNCPRWGAAAGAAAGMITGMALGVHLADRSRGDFMPVLGRTALVNGGFWALSYVTYRLGADADMVIIPLGMGAAIASAIHVQRR